MSWVARLFGNKKGADMAAAEKHAAQKQARARKARSQNKTRAKKDVLENLEKPLAEKIDAEIAPKNHITEDSAVAAKKRDKRKISLKRGMYLVAILIVGYGINLLFKPFQGDMKFGICRVFLEQQLNFPDTLRLSTVQDFGESVRIWYSHIDAFGAYRLEPLECFFRADENYGAALEYVTIGRREVDPDKVARFNKSIPAIFAYPPDLTLPTGFPDTLNDLKFDASMFRKPLL